MGATTNTFRLTLLAAALAMAGCSSLDGFKQIFPDKSVTTIPAVAPASTAAVRQGLSIDRWWTVFNDPALDRLIEEALARNEDLESAVARVRESQASLDVARAAQSPLVDLTVRSSRDQRSTVSSMPMPKGLDLASSNRIALEASYELDLWGRLASTTAAARNQLLATEWARATVEWSLTARVAEAYFGLAAVDRQIEISEAVRASRASTLDLRRREREAGAGNEFDFRRAEAELTGTEATLASLTRQRSSFDRALTALLGRSATEIVTRQVARGRMDESRAVQTVLPQGAAADLLVRRPDIRQGEAQLAAANSSVEAARAATLPQVSLAGAIGTDARSIGNLFSGPALIWTLAASIAQPLIDGGRLEARVREEHARGEQALANYRRTVAAAMLDVREAYENLDQTHEQLRAERERVASLARAREIAKVGFDNGALSYLDLLDAERNWYQAQLNQVSAYRDQLNAQVAAFKALGGGYTSSKREAL